MKNQICIINVYYGLYPEWFFLFLKSCESNTIIDWYFFSDQQHIPITSHNIKHIEITLDKLSTLISKNLNLKIKIKDPYKLCDFKPAFGKIFQDYLKDYDFWGYCDIDLIFGDLSSFITESILKTNDVISFYKGFLSGPFCLYRNDKCINELYKQSSGYPDVYRTEKHFGFDENIQRQEILKLSLYKIIKAIHFFFLYIFSGNFRRASWKEFRYQFQWFYKKTTLNSHKLIDMTEVVWFNTKRLKIKSWFNELLLSDRYFNRINYKNWKLIWDHGKLIDEKNGKRIFAFHFVDLKHKPAWEIPEINDVKNRFSITTKGIYIEK